MITTVTLNPCIDKTIRVAGVKLGEIQRAEGVEFLAGGKGINVARVLKNLGAMAQAFTLVGGPYGQVLLALLAREGIPVSYEEVGGWTRTVVTVLDTVSGVSSAWVEPGPELTEAEIARVRARVEKLGRESEFLVLSGSVPCTRVNGIYAEIIRARAQGTRVVLDTRDTPLALGLAARPFLVKPNLAELEGIWGRSLQTEAAQIAAVRELVAQGIEVVVLSLGKEGALLGTAKELWRAWPPPVTEVNPVGSGDSFLAGMLMALTRGAEIPEALRWGTAAGAANAAMWAAACCTREQVEALLPDVRIKRLA